MPDLLGDATPVDRHASVIAAEYVYQDSWGCTVDGGHLDVTHPSVVTDRAHAMWADYDLDRLVVHYMQPHLPFRSRPEWFSDRDDLDTFGEEGAKTYATEEKELWKQLRDGERDRGAVWAAYCDNLRWVHEDIDRLRRAVAADLLITSDHGNAMGEWGVWGHPPEVNVSTLRRVPWVYVDGVGCDEFISRDDVGERTTMSTAEQLAALGYK